MNPANNGLEVDLWLGRKSDRIITLVNIVAPQYETGITTIEAFHTDGTFVALKAEVP